MGHCICRNDEDVNPVVMTIGNNNVFEVDCEVHCKGVGDNNIVESKGN